jgi:hypothetical protein
MVIASRKSEAKGSCVLKNIRVEGKVNEGHEVLVRCHAAPFKWKGFESYMVMWTKLYGRV